MSQVVCLRLLSILLLAYDLLAHKVFRGLQQLGNETITEDILNSMRIKINEHGIACYHLKQSNMVEDYINSIWKAQIGNNPIMVYPLCLAGKSMGNHLGTFLNEASCAAISGAHFIAAAVPNLDDINDHIPLNGGNRSRFLDGLDLYVLNNSSDSSSTVKDRLFHNVTSL